MASEAPADPVADTVAAAAEPVAAVPSGEYHARPEHDARRVFSISRREKLRTCGLQPHYGWLQNGADEYVFFTVPSSHVSPS